jgi:hypothetical protein
MTTEAALFHAPWDQKLAILTIVLSTIVLGSSGLLVFFGGGLPRPVRLLMLLSAGLAIGAWLAALLLAPRGYSVEAGRLRIERLVAPIDIPLASIQSAARLEGEELAGSLRTIGSGGLFGYYGRFRNRSLGTYRMYATRGEDYVVVRADRPYVLTPDSPARFLDALERARAQRREAE